MMALIAEYTIRTIALGVLVFVILKALRVSDPRLERIVWRIVLVAAVSMPAVLQLSSLPRMPTSMLAMNYAELVMLPGSHRASAWSSSVLALLGAVSAAFVLRYLMGVARCWAMRKRATKVTSTADPSLDVRVSREVSSPATVFSTVLVPSDFERWTVEAQRLAIAHERSHVASKDFYVQGLAQIYRAVCWFNPFAWWLAARLALLNEHVSDDAALASRGESADQGRAAYARVLLRLARRSPVSTAFVPMIRARSLGLRVERILQQTGASRASVLQTMLVACTFIPILAAAAAIPTTEIVLPKSNPSMPLSPPIYPPESRRLGETGTVVLKLHVLENGTVSDAAIVETSGHPELDFAAASEALRWHLEPGTVDGAPSNMWGRFAVTFKLGPD